MILVKCNTQDFVGKKIITGEKKRGWFSLVGYVLFFNLCIIMLEIEIPKFSIFFSYKILVCRLSDLFVLVLVFTPGSQ